MTRSTFASLLNPLGALYGSVVRARAHLYRLSILRSEKIPAPVISVGNITVGGTGKTPLVEWIARRIAEDDRRRVCILTRGYGRANIRERIVVSDGEQLLADARIGGDEPRLLAEKLLGAAAVVSDRDRTAAARWAMKNLGSDAFILDDGFQHLRIERDLDIVTIDASEPWGGRSLLPQGRLREPASALQRADCIVITRAEQATNIGEISKEASRLSGGRPVILSYVHTSNLRPLSSVHIDQNFERDPSCYPIAVFCALGNPQAFVRHVRNDKFNVALEKVFPDHHRYTQQDADELASAASEHNARVLLTTAKDAVKLASLNFALPCYVLEAKLEFDDEAKLLSMVRKVLSDDYMQTQVHLKTVSRAGKKRKD